MTFHSAVNTQGILTFHTAVNTQGILTFHIAVKTQEIVTFHTAVNTQGIVTFHTAVNTQGIVWITASSKASYTNMYSSCQHIRDTDISYCCQYTGDVGNHCFQQSVLHKHVQLLSTHTDSGNHCFQLSIVHKHVLLLSTHRGCWQSLLPAKHRTQSLWPWIKVKETYTSFQM